MFRKIVVAYDGSEGAQQALERALDLVKQASQELWLVSVHGTPLDFASSHGEVEQGTEAAELYLSSLQQHARDRAAAAGVRLHTALRHGNVAKRIVEYAGEGGFDLLVLGRSGYSGVWEPFLGTVADKLVRHAPCSVLVVR
ncbi:MAG: universal stress protein [Chloroflexi bacterium]|nr:universal stress protein [Chloroflexota bacterium]